MLRDPELLALVEQAARNLDTLELLARSAKETDLTAIQDLRQRVDRLKERYTRDTNALTQRILKGAIERRREADRRRTTRRHSGAPLQGVR